MQRGRPRCPRIACTEGGFALSVSSVTAVPIPPREFAGTRAPGGLGHDRRNLIVRHIASGPRPAKLLLALDDPELLDELREAGIEVSIWPTSSDRRTPGRPHYPSPPTSSLSARYDFALVSEQAADSDASAERLAADLCARVSEVLLRLDNAPGDGGLAGNLAQGAAWAERFARHGFLRDFESLPAGAHTWLLDFRPARCELPEVVGRYERRLADVETALADHGRLARQRQQELLALEQSISAMQAQIHAWEGRWLELQAGLSWRAARWLRTLRSRYAPLGSRADWTLQVMLQAARAYRRLGLIGSARATTLRVAAKLRALPGGLKTALLGRRPRASAHYPREVVHTRAIEPPSPVPPHQASVDIIICVHNALEDVARCLESVRQHANPPCSVILVDDGSGSETRDFLARWTQVHGATLIRNEAPGGYTRAANLGLRRSTAEYSLLLNSDTVVTADWLDRLLACATSDARIGIVGPLSNTASWQSVPRIADGGDWANNPLPEGLSVDEMGRLVAATSARLSPRLPFLNGFCLLVRRELIAQIGYFDEETFGAGYGEENDYCLRAGQAGWQLAVADDAYIFHRQSRSYSDERRKALCDRAGAALAHKHPGSAIDRGVVQCRQNRVMEGVRARVQTMVERQDWIQQGRARFAGKRVLFVLPVSAPGGGANIVLLEAAAMRRMGADAAIFNLYNYQEAFRASYPRLQVPVVFGATSDLPEIARPYDAVVATANFSVAWLKPVEQGNQRLIRGYYIQDFEPYFYPDGSPGYRTAWESYALLPDLVRFTKTEWNRHEVHERTGVDCVPVGASVDVDLFRPRPREQGQWPDRPLRIAAMVRPQSAIRAPHLTMEVLRQAWRRYGPGVEIVIFGAQPELPALAAMPSDFPCKVAGVLPPEATARLLNEADIFVDFSTYQAMGLTALEAMCTGAATIVPAKGGADSYARHGVNSLVADTSSSEACVTALRHLIEDHALRAQLQQHAILDAAAKYPERTAFNILSALFGG